jgi:sugar phosphate permease
MKVVCMAGLTGMGLSAVALVAGAIMRYAVSAQSTGFNIHKIGVILMIAGAIGVVISSILFFSTRNTPSSGTHTMHSETRDSSGNAVIQDRTER